MSDALTGLARARKLVDELDEQAQKLAGEAAQAEREAREAKDRRARALERARSARTEREQARALYLRSILEARENGGTYRDIGECLGVSPQRVMQLVRKAEEEAALPPGRHF